MKANGETKEANKKPSNFPHKSASGETHSRKLESDVNHQPVVCNGRLTPRHMISIAQSCTVGANVVLRLAGSRILVPFAFFSQVPHFRR